MSDMTIQDFASWVEGACDVVAGDERCPMTLIAAQDLPGSPRDGGGFRLEFRGPADPVLPQSIMTVTREAEVYTLFMVPIGRDSTGTRYEAVFY